MKKIAYVLTPIDFGGSERVNITFLRNVDRMDYDISPIILIRPWEKKNLFMNQLEEAKYLFYKIPVAIKPRSEGRDWFRIFRCIKNLLDILRAQSFDLIHTHGYFADIIGIPASKMLGLPQISTCHGFISNDMNLKIYNRLDKYSLRFCEKVIAVSEEIKKHLLRNGVKESKIVVIQNAVQNSYGETNILENRIEKRRLLSIEDNEFIIGYLGRLSKEKGVQYLIDAGLILKEKDEAVRILIIGDGPKREELESLAKEKGLEKEIIFTGFQNDVEKWLPALDVFVLSSLTEGTPMALLEAMAAGIPVIATSVGGVPNVIENGVNGILTNAADSKALADKIMTLMHNPSIGKKMVDKGVETIEKQYNVYQWCRKIEAQYDLLRRKNS